jgi:hypothetical protein
MTPPATRKYLTHKRLIAAGLILGIALTGSSAALAAHTDVVTFKNGDKLTGEVKTLNRGRLTFKNDPVGTIFIQWDEIAYLSVDQDIQVETQNGARYFGHILLGDEEFQIVVDRPSGPEVIDASRVISMNPIDQHGLRDIDLDVSLGYNFTKASNITQFSFDMDAQYRTRQRILFAEMSSSLSDSTGNETSERQTLNLNYTRLRANRWLNDGGLSFEHNDELGINLRTSLSAGGGRILVQSNHSNFILTGGLKATRENINLQVEEVDSLESYGMLSWEWFRYDTPELDWSTNLEIIPSLTESGRVRSEFDATLKWEIVADLYWRLSYFFSYDNQPQATSDVSEDFGVTTSIGYSF